MSAEVNILVNYVGIFIDKLIWLFADLFVLVAIFTKLMLHLVLSIFS